MTVKGLCERLEAVRADWDGADIPAAGPAEFSVCCPRPYAKPPPPSTARRGEDQDAVRGAGAVCCKNRERRTAGFSIR